MHRLDHRSSGSGLPVDLDVDVEQRTTDSSFTASFIVFQSAKPSRWYSTSGSRWAMARRPMPSWR